MLKVVGWRTFRHSYSRLLRASHTDVKVQQEILRHSNIHHDERLHASCEQAEAEAGLNNLFAFIANCYNRGSFYMRHGSGNE